jgi:hypothetical protein
MTQAGEDTTLRIKLGNDRKEIGDFACFIHYLFGINGR